MPFSLTLHPSYSCNAQAHRYHISIMPMPTTYLPCPLIPLMFRRSHANEIPCAHPPVHHSHYYPHPAMQRPLPLTLPSAAAGRGSPRERIRVARRWMSAASSVVAACFVTMQPCTSAAGTIVVSVFSPQDGRPLTSSWKAMKRVRRNRACWRSACMHTWRAQYPWASPEGSLPPWACLWVHPV